MRPYDELPIGNINDLPIDLKRLKNLQLISVYDGIYKLRDKNSGETAVTASNLPYLIDLKKVQQ